jgi:prepilin-type N-terminal cleavage/methylation domain-containing protein
VDKLSNQKKGFTLLELLIGLSIGIIVLTGLMSFFFRTSKMIQQEQNSVKNLSQLQFVMNKIVQDIKEANTELPGAGTTMTVNDWKQLPHLPYGRTYTSIITEPNDSLERIAPAYPVAYNFPNFQAGKTGTPDGWYPKIDISTPSNELEAQHKPESNQLAFYKVVNNKITRVIYYSQINMNDTINPKSLVLKRRQQFANTANPFLLSNNFEDTNLQFKEETILSNVKAIQFTYPNLSKRLEAGPAFDNSLKSTLSGTTDSYIQSKIMNPYRDTIKIKIITAGIQISNYRSTALELETEVNIRN